MPLKNHTSQAPEGKRVLVTGASSGIGLAIAQALDQAGWHVINFDINEPSQPIGQFAKVDMSNAADLMKTLASITGDPLLVGLVNNVGMVRPALLEQTTLEDFDYQMSVNARAALLCTQALLPGMRSAGFGRVVNISSRAALGKELRTAYAGTKGTLNAFTKTWALELGRAGITVNAVAPGPIGTEAFFIANPPESARTQQIIAAVPVGRMGRPEDVAAAVEFLMQNRSGFITGQVLNVCGGMTVGLAH